MDAQTLSAAEVAQGKALLATATETEQVFAQCSSQDSHYLRLLENHCNARRVLDTWLLNHAPALIAAAERERWIPVEERLPEMGKPVWALMKSGSIGIFARVDDDDGWLWANSYGSAWFSDGKWQMDLETDDDYEVVMWKDLPLPPAPGAQT